MSSARQGAEVAASQADAVGCRQAHGLPGRLHRGQLATSSFQQWVESFHENPSIRGLPCDTYISQTITLVSCGPPLRSLAERLSHLGPSESEPAWEAAANALDHVTHLSHRVLADLLFQELQPHFSKVMCHKQLTISEALDDIVGTLGAQTLALRRMHDQPYQALVGELHQRPLVQYVEMYCRGLFWVGFRAGGSSSGFWALEIRIPGLTWFRGRLILELDI
uniref:Exocyst complex component 3-like protein 2 n=1 Tax=Phascolarctos cinereus TaxID=38626 RepID=A0A6P5JQ31_PHACI|nr:exocyst complex component 3-like protein 2 [Phascolarctos cinereus]